MAAKAGQARLPPGFGREAAAHDGTAASEGAGTPRSGGQVDEVQGAEIFGKNRQSFS